MWSEPDSTPFRFNFRAGPDDDQAAPVTMGLGVGLVDGQAHVIEAHEIFLDDGALPGPVRRTSWAHRLTLLASQDEMDELRVEPMVIPGLERTNLPSAVTLLKRHPPAGPAAVFGPDGILATAEGGDLLPGVYEGGLKGGAKGVQEVAAHPALADMRLVALSSAVQASERWG